MSSDDLNGGDSVGTGEEDERTEDGTRGDEVSTGNVLGGVLVCRDVPGLP